MRTTCTVLMLTLALVAVCHAQEEMQSCVERDGVLYGAQADERGPIGGGEGYTAIVTEGDYTATTLEELIAALEQAQPGETVFIPLPTNDTLSISSFATTVVVM